MEFELTAEIHRAVDEVFFYLADMRNHPQEERTKVLKVEKMSAGPVGAGTRFREVVQMLPLVRVEMVSEVTAYEPEEGITFTWSGGGMEGVLALSFAVANGGTRLVLRETIRPLGPMRLAAPLVYRAFKDTQSKRLEGLKHVLEHEEEGHGA